MDETKMDGKSMDLTKENIERMKELFPEIVTEGKVDFEKLKLILGENIDSNSERYSFIWNGKTQSICLSQAPSTGTLRPCEKESSCWGNTNNIYIEGDNLEVLKLLQKSYFGKIKMIYIDPPYNTGKDFVYADSFSDTIENYKKITGQIDDNGKSVSTNTETDGKYHTNWLNMIYPRLKISRNLLRDDGIIFISIDDNEVDNLKKICDEIYGVNNFIGELPTIMNLKGNNDEFCFAGCHEYTLVYCKSKDDFVPCQYKIEEELDEWEQDESGYYKKGATLKRTGEDGPREKRPYGYFPILINRSNKTVSAVDRSEYDQIYNAANKSFDDVFVDTLVKKYQLQGFDVVLPNNGVIKTSWRWGYDKVVNESREILVMENNGLYKKQRPELGELPSKKPKSILYKAEYSSGNGTAEIKDLFGGLKVFSHPKPVELIKDLIEVATGNDTDAIILDFFSGSSTTANAVMMLNTEDEGHRSSISIQLPEKLILESNSPDAVKQAIEYLDSKKLPHNICEIGKERIRLAGSKIVKYSAQQKLNGYKPDVGFRVFKLDTSNIKKWNPDADNLKKSLSDFEENLRSDEGRYDLDIVYEILLKMGLKLTSNIEKIEVGDSNLYSVSTGALMIYLGKVTSTAIAEKMIEVYNKESPTIWKVVFRDGGFDNDDIKANTRETLKNAGLQSDSFVTL